MCSHPRMQAAAIHPGAEPERGQARLARFGFNGNWLKVGQLLHLQLPVIHCVVTWLYTTLPHIQSYRSYHDSNVMEAIYTR